jgi:hypothetical protein
VVGVGGKDGSPLQNAGAVGGGFGFRNVACVLKADGEGGVGERVLRCENGETQSDGDGGFKLAGISQGADETVMGFNVFGIEVDDGTEVTGCGLGIPLGEGIVGGLEEGVGVHARSE